MEKAAEHQSKTKEKSVFALSVWGALVFFLILWKLDFPKPMWDDLFYTGAGLNMAQGGDFSNPLLARQQFPSHYFYVYPPLHAYAVYWWVSVWGISAASLLAFQNLMYFIIAWMMIILLRRHGAGELFSWLAPWGVAAVFLKTGLRPEPFAAALMMAGYALLQHCRKAGFWLWVSFLLMFLGPMAAPRMTFFAAALVLVGGWQWMRQGPGKSSWVQFWGVAALALGATVLIFLALIDFRLAEFTRTFHMHATRLSGNRLGLLHNFMNDLGTRWWPIFFLTVAVLCVSIRRASNDLKWLCYGLAATFVLAAPLGGLGPGSTWYIIFILFLLSSALVQKRPRMQGLVLEGAIVAVLLIANSTKLIETYGLATGKIEEKPPENREAILGLKSTEKHPVLVDPCVARYVFDYKLPVGYIDYGFSAPFPGFVATDTKLRENDIFLLGPSMVCGLNGMTGTDYPVEWWNVLGSKNWSQFRHPREAYVIPARDCMHLEVGK